VPSPGMHRRLVTQLASRMLVVDALDALVVPAFEVKEAVPFGAEEHLARSDMAKLVVAGSAEGFHLSRYPKGHTNTDFKKWFSQDAPFDQGDALLPYPVNYSHGFEPYVLVRQDQAHLPKYDERFRGYGLNKVSHLMALHEAGYMFKVAPWSDVMVTAREHPSSPDYRKTYGTQKDPLVTMHVQALFNVFQREVKSKKPSAYATKGETVVAIEMDKPLPVPAAEEWDVGAQKTSKLAAAFLSSSSSS